MPFLLFISPKKTKMLPRTLTIILMIVMVNQNARSQSSTPDNAHTILWEITASKKPAYKSYLLGSRHIHGEKFLNTIGGIKEMVNAASVFICESAPSTIASEQASYDQKIPYADLFNAEQTKVVDSFLLKHNIDNLKSLDSGHFPINRLLFMVMGQLIAENSESIQQLEEGMDNVLKRWAQQANIPIRGLDSGFVAKKNTLSLGLEDHQIAEMIHNLVTGTSATGSSDLQLEQNPGYQDFEIDYDFKSKPVYVQNEQLKHLLTDRNEYWMPKLIAEFTNAKCFAVVGIEHLKYKNGLLKSLQKAGFTVKPVRITKVKP